MESISIPISSRKHPGLVAWIDADDVGLVAGRTWFVRVYDHTFYAFAWDIRKGRRRRIHLHELVSGIRKPDHVDGDGLNNRKSNLRTATPQQQMRNQRIRKTNTSGFKGVSLRRDTGRWHARIQTGTCYLHLGFFDSPEDAASAYDAAAVLLFGEYARINGESIEPRALRAMLALLRDKGIALAT